MTLSLSPPLPGRAAPRATAPVSGGMTGALLGGGLLGLALTLPKAMQVWSTGIFLNPDDAMRAVEVRDLLAGQAFFDLVPHRLSPDHPFAMHWSRLIDLPLAAMTWGFGLVLSPGNAELAMRLLTPSLLFVVALWLMAGLARALIGPRAMLPATLLMAGSAEVVGTFIPGHIHHHAAQVTLLLGASCAMLHALAPRAHWRLAAGAGALAALSLGIGLQNLPFVIGLTAIAAFAWVWRGETAALLLAGFGAAAAATGLAVFLVDVPPWGYGTGACDAFSTAHLLAAAAGGLALVGLAAASARLPTVGHRGMAAATAGLAVLGLLLACYPACLHDPMAGVDPLLRDKWLAGVGEALPLARLIALDPVAGLVLALTLACGLAATVAALLAAQTSRRAPWAGLLLLGLVGLCGTAYQVRVAGSACALLIPGVAWSIVALYDRLAIRPGRPALLAAVVAGLLGNGAGLAAVAGPVARLARPTPAGAAVGAAAADPTACFDPAVYAPLAALPPGLVLSTIDPGSTILATTAHSVLAAPYHRNTAGNTVALIAFETPPAAARPIVIGARATYVALCRASNEARDTASQHPDSLAAALLAGRTPAWLTPIGTGREQVLLYRVTG